jgi:hypothetical protein
LHHDNAPAHTALSFQQFLAKTKMVVSYYPTHPISLLVSIFFLYPPMKHVLKVSRFADVAEVQRESLAGLTAFPLKILDNVSRSESIARIVASRHVGSTLKRTKVSNILSF